MSGTTFNGVLRSSTFDHAAARLREQMEQERRELQYQARVARWLAHTLAGQSFDSLEALQTAARAAALVANPALDDRQATALTRAATHLWCGVVERRHLRNGYRLDREAHTLTFLAVA